MESPPAFQFYAKDHLATIELLTPEEAKAWIRLVCHAWLNDGTAPALLAARIATPEVLESLRLFTTQSEAGISFQWMDVLREKQAERRRVNAENGGKGGRGNKRGSKAKSERFTESKQMQSEKKPSRAANAIEDSISTRRKERARPEYSPEFEALWRLWDGKGSKGKAFSYWIRLTPDEQQQIVLKAPDYVKYYSGDRYGFRKHLDGWINPDERRWEAPVPGMEAHQPKLRVPAGLTPPPL